MAHVDASTKMVDGKADNPQPVESERSERLEFFIALTKEERVRFKQQVDERYRKLIDLFEN